MSADILIAGACVADIPLYPVDAAVFDRGSTPLDSIAMQGGGDAMNESIVLSRLGVNVALISKLGTDAAGDFLLNRLKASGVDTVSVNRDAALLTAINIVLIGEDGERRFITNRNGTLRKLSLGDILPTLEASTAKIFCLASTFVSPELSVSDTAQLFETAKSMGMAVCADTTKPKRGETLKDIAPFLAHLDYYFPNLEEARAISELSDPDAIADACLEAGLKHIAIKLGSKGCLIRDGQTNAIVSAYPNAPCVDTTGAGDTFAAAFQTMLLRGGSFRDCARFANAASSFCIESVGATGATFDFNAVLDRMKRIP